MPPTDRALKPVSSARTNATKDLGRGDPVANGPPSKESDHNHSGCAVDGETVETVTTAVAGALAAAAKQVREQLPVSDFCQDAEPARKPVVERTETRKERVKRLVASLMHATRAELADLIPALVETSSDLNLLRVYLHRICESKQKDHVSTKKDIQERFKTIVILLETSSSIGSELTELIKEYLNANENESNIRFEYNKAAHISALFVVYADIAELKADSAAERKVLEDKIALLKDTYDEQAKCSEAKIAQLRSDLESANGKVTELQRVVAKQQVAIEQSLAIQQELEGELAATKEIVRAGDVAWLDVSVKGDALEQDLAATSSALATAKSQLLAMKADKRAFGFGVFALLAVVVLVLGMLIPQAFDECAFDSLQANKLKDPGTAGGSDVDFAIVLSAAPLLPQTDEEAPVDAPPSSLKRLSLSQSEQAAKEEAQHKVDAPPSSLKRLSLSQSEQAAKEEAQHKAPIKLAVSAEEMEKINATKVEVLALTNALDACVNIAGRVCFLGLKDAFTFNAAVEMTFAHEAIDVEEHEADHEAIVELIDAALASLDAKPAGAVKSIESALVAHYVAFDRFEAFVSE